ncbi:hypothetical protein MOTE_09820 [Moorella thermoacetica]|uniref:Uncharacterized protein n=1 Tax=Neomoorella thermoacetica TaxID=1525 RepID=A0A1J5NMA1_NEOTH|nr:hypothetical protein MOTE_09820 [Moorella thermoacetica]
MLDTGGHVLVSVKDMVLKGEQKKKAVTITADAVVIHPAPYDENWDFLAEE